MLDKKRLTLNILFQIGRPEIFLYFCIRFFFWYSDYSAESDKFGAFKKKELEKNKLVRKQN